MPGEKLTLDGPTLGVLDDRSGVAPPADPRDRHYLMVFHGETSTSFALPFTGSVLIGRSDEAHLRIDDHGVSRRHAMLTIDQGEARLADLGSHNGVWVNDERIVASRLLLSGDSVTIGGANLVYHASASAPRHRRALDFPQLRARLAEEVERAARFSHELTIVVLQPGATVQPAGPLPPAPGGPWPLIIFSHCHNCVRFSAFTVAERLASHGFLVAAPDHTGNTLFDQLNGMDTQIGEEFLQVRVADLQAVLDALLAAADPVPAPLQGLVDAARIGALGHSFGAATAGRIAQADPRIKAAVDQDGQLFVVRWRQPTVESERQLGDEVEQPHVHQRRAVSGRIEEPRRALTRLERLLLLLGELGPFVGRDREPLLAVAVDRDRLGLG